MIVTAVANIFAYKRKNTGENQSGATGSANDLNPRNPLNCKGLRGFIESA